MSSQGTPSEQQQMAQLLQQQKAMGPPWMPITWSLGGIPSVGVDVPITAVFMALYMAGAATHMTIFQLNRRRDHKFIMSGLMFGFCMARMVTCILRIASICVAENIRLKIAAQIFVSAGVLLIYIINLLFSQRLVRAMHPNLGWHKSFHFAFVALYALIGVTFAMVITVTVQTFYTLSTHTHTIDRDIQMYAATYLGFVSFIPIPLVTGSLLWPRRQKIEKFGAGRFRTKIVILLAATTLITLGAWFRAGTMYKDPVPRIYPCPAYFHRACFYVFNFVVEILVVYFYAILRIDLRFHIPNGAHGPGSYTPPQEEIGTGEEEQAESEKASTTEGRSTRPTSPLRRLSSASSRVYPEEEAFDFMPDPETTLENAEKKNRDLESGPTIDTRRSGDTHRPDVHRHGSDNVSAGGTTAVQTPV